MTVVFGLAAQDIKFVIRMIWKNLQYEHKLSNKRTIFKCYDCIEF